MRSLLFAGASCLIPFTLASLVNMTVDDTYGDPQTGSRIVYSPAGAWNDGTQSCSTACTTRPDPGRLYKGTWHDSTFIPHSGNNDDSNLIPSASVIFNGSALYVYCVIAHSGDENSYMTFFIDNEVVGKFSAAAPTGNKSNHQYDVPVYANHSIPAGVHTFTLQNGHEGGQKSLVMLDSIVYTHDNGGKLLYTTPSPSQPEAKSRHGVLIGSILGTLVGFLFIAPGIYLCVRFHKRRQRLAPSQQYAASKPTRNWFEERRASTGLQIIDLIPEMEEACVAPRRPHYPDALRAFIANNARTVTRSEAVSSASQSTSQREPPLKPGRTFRVMNR